MRTPAFLLLATIVITPLSLCAQQLTLPLWPHGAPEATTNSRAERNATTPTDHPATGGKPFIRLVDVSKPTLTLYPAPATSAPNTAVLVFPGGGYKLLAYDLEGTEVCTWLNSIGVTCILVKYRVPFDHPYPVDTADLDDAQQAMRITRAHAAEWRIDPKRIGVLGFSAGAHLSVVLSNHSDFHFKGEETPTIDAKPNFALIIYPGSLIKDGDVNTPADGIEATASTPPTFLAQAENDPVHVENAVGYFMQLKRANVPTELHIFAEGGHGYGLRPSSFPISHWPSYTETWLHTIHMLPPTDSK